MRNSKTKAFSLNNDNNLSRRLFIIFNYIFISIVTFISILPILNVLCMSFSKNIYVSAGQVYLWPKGFTLESYKFVFKNKELFLSVLTSVKVVLLGVGLVMTCTILVAYTLSRNEKTFRARKVFVWFFMVTMIFNGGIVPVYMIVKITHVYDTLLACFC